jgi:hypothetical protein
MYTNTISINDSSYQEECNTRIYRDSCRAIRELSVSVEEEYGKRLRV